MTKLSFSIHLQDKNNPKTIDLLVESIQAGDFDILN